MGTVHVKTRLIISLLAAAGIVGLLYWFFSEKAGNILEYALDTRTPPSLAIALFVLLPLVGFPISACLVLLGVKLGGWLGLAIMFAGIPIHLLVAWFVARSFLQAWLKNLLAKFDRRPPQVPSERAGWFCFLFMAFPGLSYTLKNYILALSGAPFGSFFLSGYLVQGVIGIPFVIAGDAVAEESLLLLAAVFVLLLVIYAIVWKLRQRHPLSLS
jgi:uncharacterized membrane protein YdjX (TVP38/TMEM64 family)